MSGPVPDGLTVTGPPAAICCGGLPGTAAEAVRAGDGDSVRLIVLDVAGDRRTGPALEREVLDQPADPRLVPVLSAGTLPDRRPWWTEPVTTAWSPPLPLTPAEAFEVLQAVADAAAALHAAGRVHGPIADDDVCRLDGLTALRGARPACLADLGGDPPATLVPPEVHAGSGWTPTADVWAVAALGWRLLHARPHAPDLLAAVQGVLPEPRADLPAALRVGLLAGLSPEPAARPATAPALLALLAGGTDRRDTLPPGAPVPTGIGRALGSGYLLTEPIGRGASGQVWRGVRRRDGRPVAVKLLRPELAEDPETVVRFLRERTVLVGIAHPSLVQVHDLVAEEGVLGVVMDLVDGPDLRRLLAERPPAPATSLRLLGQVAGALAAVHASGVVHRDLKPENVLVEPSGAARLTDFGIAKAVGGPALTRLSAIVGTPEYLAPEVASGREAAAPADVYSLGVLLYEMLAGRRPFDAPHPAAVLRAHLQDAPVRPDELPDPLWQVMAACLAKDPEQRPVAAELATLLPALAEGASALELRPRPVRSPAAAAEALPTAAATAPAPPAPAPAPAATGSWLRRRALVLLCLGAVAVAGLSGWYTARPDDPPPPPPLRSDLVGLQVFADPADAGTVRLRFDGSRIEGLQGFVVLQDGQPAADGLVPGTTEHLATPGDTEEHCYTVLALTEVPADSPPPAAPPPRACVRALP